MPQRRNYKKCSRLVKAVSTLSNLRRLPRNSDVLQRRQTLQNAYVGKSKSLFLSLLAKEIEQCWKNQDIPVQSWTAIYNKLQRTKLSSNNCLFNCLPTKPNWKTNEDKVYYFQQKSNLGGYCTSKKVPYKIHPSKRSVTKMDVIPPFVTTVPAASSDEGTVSSNDGAQSDISFTGETHSTVSGDANFAQLLRERANLSISQTIAVMQFYRQQFPAISSLPVPPAKGTLSVASRAAAASMSKTIPIAAGINHTLYYDMKQYRELYSEKREIICVCIDNLLLDFDELPNKKAVTISNFLFHLIERYNISCIVSDTEPTNTGSKGGVIALVKQRFPHVVFEPCRLHVLDLILKHEMQHLLGKTPTTGPLIPYNFVSTLQSNWSFNRNKYLAACQHPVSSFPDLPENESRRDDYRFLLELTKAVRTLKQLGERRYVNIPRSPSSISLARWNSKAIYSLMHELFLETANADICSLNNFIVNQWAPVWFGIRDLADWGKLNNISPSSTQILMKHGLLNKLESKPPTNEFAERVFRMANEKIPRCHSLSALRNALVQYVNYTPKLN
jgi:hypothetical protein